MEDRRQRLSKALERRDKLRGDVQRIKGKLEAARAEKQTLEDECRSKGIDPEKLDDTITQLISRYEKAIEDLENKLTQAEKALAPFLEA